jgi:hypothetical protein
VGDDEKHLERIVRTFRAQTGEIRGRVTTPIYDNELVDIVMLGAAAVGFVAGHRANLCRLRLAARAQGARLRGD